MLAYDKKNPMLDVHHELYHLPISGYLQQGVPRKRGKNRGGVMWGYGVKGGGDEYRHDNFKTKAHGSRPTSHI